MPVWPRCRASRLVRAFSTYSHDRVNVACGSAGHVTVEYVPHLTSLTHSANIRSLFNISHHSPSTALVVHLPPCPSLHDPAPAPLPDFLQDWPVASINYRWGSSPTEDYTWNLNWPAPVHDTAYAYAWLAKNLATETGRRDMFVYGSHLGASLAASLALTESHTHARFGVRGVVAYNGVYNWTMFLPDHRINQSKSVKATPPKRIEGSHLSNLEDQMPALFGTPTNLFDPFASPALLFHHPGLIIPRSFTMSISDAAMIDALASKNPDSIIPVKKPRKSHMVFPPRTSTLKIPETLLLYDSPAPQPQEDTEKRTRRRTAAAPRGNTLEAQAEELAELMRRSIEKGELKDRSKWDDDMDSWADEGLRRVQVTEVGEERGDLELGEPGQEIALDWMRDRI